MDSSFLLQIVSALMVFVLFGLGVFIYVLPPFIALVRKHPQAAGITVVTILTGWTTMGWIATLIWSFITPQAPVVIAPPALPPPVPGDAHDCNGAEPRAQVLSVTPLE